MNRFGKDDSQRILERILAGCILAGLVLAAFAAAQFAVTGRVDVFIAANAVLFGGWGTVAARFLRVRSTNRICPACQANRRGLEHFCARCARDFA